MHEDVTSSIPTIPLTVIDSPSMAHDRMFTIAGYDALIRITLDMGQMASALYMKPMANTPARMPADAIKATRARLRAVSGAGSANALIARNMDAVKY